MKARLRTAAVAAALLVAGVARAQFPAAPQPLGGSQQPPPAQAPPPAAAAPPQAQPAAPASVRPAGEYVLGPGDLVLVQGQDIEEISGRVYPVDGQGGMTLPMIGRLEVGGTTLEKVEAEIVQRLGKYVRNPHVVLSLTQFRSEPIFILGAFRSPGVFQLQGRRRLVEMLSTVGGLAPNASRRIRITRTLDRGPIPSKKAVQDPVARITYVEIDLSENLESLSPEDDIVLLPYDVVRATVSELVYTSGRVGRTGGFEVVDKEFLPMTKLLAMAGGLAPDADAGRARVMRTILDSSRRAEIPIDINAILEGRAEDFPLMPNDLLIVPPKPGGIGKNVWTFGRIIVPSLITSLIWILIRR